MDPVQHAYIRAQLGDITARIAAYAEAMAWALRDRPPLNLSELLPPMTTPEAGVALQRYAQMTAGIGRDVFMERTWGTIGSVGWSGNEAPTDEALSALDLEALARDAFGPLLVGGIAAGMAYLNSDGKPDLDIMSGYVQPITEAEDSSDISQLYQAVSNPDGRTYRVRLYDLKAQTVTEWPSLKDPTTLFTLPGMVLKWYYPPRFAIAAKDENGLPIGEFMEGLGLLRAELAQQIKQLRMEESQAFSMMKLLGNFDEVNQMGPNVVIRGPDPLAQADRIPPGDFKPIQEQHDRLLERIRRRFAGKARLSSTANLSGAAVDQANLTALSAYAFYARLLSRLLSELTADYAALAKVPPVEVTVSVNKDSYRTERMTEILNLYKEGLISLDMAVGEIRNFYSFTDEQVRRFIGSRSTVTGADIQRLFGGGGNG